VQPATLDGIENLLSEVHSESALRFQKIRPYLQELVGQQHFQKRIDAFEPYWEEWVTLRTAIFGSAPQQLPAVHIPTVNSSSSVSTGITHDNHHIHQSYSFDDYCRNFDRLFEERSDIKSSLVETRKMMCVLLSCNQYFGMDGNIYNYNGEIVGEEYMARNTPIVLTDTDGNSMITLPIKSSNNDSTIPSSNTKGTAAVTVQSSGSADAALPNALAKTGNPCKVIGVLLSEIDRFKVL